ncbi:Lactation elevated protein 1 [Smittium culicis]|uniref:Lactation elevated protein 1 n=1 Tax=Smittium culicis TaxID=133412 RepID=A0A1R1YLQ4_9FUNG|nr:Lactation elevated protein 1 [Smittium culicis]
MNLLRRPSTLKPLLSVRPIVYFTNTSLTNSTKTLPKSTAFPLFTRNYSPMIKAYKDSVLSNKIKNDLNQLAILQRLDSIHKNIDDYGNVGTGKTMIMDMFYNSLSTNKKLRVHFHSFMLKVHAKIQEIKELNLANKQSSSPISIIAKNLSAQANIICFDEFQVVDIADAMILRQLLTHLIKNNVLFIFTSNRPPDDLYKNGLQRSSFIPCITLIKSHCFVESLDSGIDYRKQGLHLPHSYHLTTLASSKRSSANIYLHSPDNAAEPIYSKLCALEGSAPTKNTEISFLGRKFTVKNSCGSIAHISFHDLCQQPLSAADYLEIVGKFKLILVSSVPQMNVLYREQARRFITFIDTMYESSAVLLMTTNVEFKSLFNVSRLKDIDASVSATSSKSDSAAADPQPDGRGDVISAPTSMSPIISAEISLEGLPKSSTILPAKKNVQNDQPPKDNDASMHSGEEELFAFDRTISRLVEMKSIDYLQRSCTQPEILDYLVNIRPDTSI